MYIGYTRFVWVGLKCYMRPSTLEMLVYLGFVKHM